MTKIEIQHLENQLTISKLETEKWKLIYRIAVTKDYGCTMTEFAFSEDIDHSNNCGQCDLRSQLKQAELNIQFYKSLLILPESKGSNND